MTFIMLIDGYVTITCIRDVHRNNFREPISSPWPIHGTFSTNFYGMELSEVLDSGILVLFIPTVASQLVR